MNTLRMTFPEETCARGHNLHKTGVYMNPDGTREGCYRCRLNAANRRNANKRARRGGLNQWPTTELY